MDQPGNYEAQAELDRPCTCHPADNPPKPCPHKYALRDCRLEQGRRLFNAMHVQPGKIEFHYEQDGIGRWGEEVRVTLPDGSHQLLLSEQDAEVTEFFAWAVNYFKDYLQE